MPQYFFLNLIEFDRNAYIELGVTLGGLVEAGFLQLGAVEAALRSAEKSRAGKGPARGHDGNRRHRCDLGARNRGCCEDWRGAIVLQKREGELDSG
jgi:hypothetical protein